LLARGAPAYGVRGDVWTAKRLAEALWRTLGVRSHPDHVSRLLRQAGWSQQRPLQRATHRDAPPTATRHPPRRGRHPSVARGAVAGQQKKAADEGSTSVGIDESAVSFVPPAARTWAPRGPPPTLPVKLTRAHRSALRGIPLAGRLCGTPLRDASAGRLCGTPLRDASSCRSRRQLATRRGEGASCASCDVRSGARCG
jgi:hypothetical protein